MKVFFIVILLIILPNISIASGSTGQMEIEWVNQRDCVNDHDFEIKFTTNHNNPDACSNASTINYSCTHTAINQITSIALAAQMSGKKVDAWVVGCDVEGQAKGVTLRVNN